MVDFNDFQGFFLPKQFCDSFKSGNQTNLHTFINYFHIYHLAKGSILRLRNELLIQARFLNAGVYSDHRKRR